MNTETIYITAWVSLRNGIAIHKGDLFYKGADSDIATVLKALYKELKCDYSRFYKMDNLSKLGFIATELLLKDRDLSKTYQPDEVALVFSNSSSSLDTDAVYYKAIEDKSNYFPSPAVFVYTLPNIVMGEICIRHRFLGENAFFISEKFDGRLLSDYSKELLASGKAKCVIAGWIETGEQGTEAVLFLFEAESTTIEPMGLSYEVMETIYHSP